MFRLIKMAILLGFVLALLAPDTLAQRRNRRWRNDRVLTVYCESGDMRRHWCREGRRGRVRLVRQRSDAACIRGRTWGVDRGGIWVDRGCRADFEVRR